jgi:hypothetical protein
MVKSPGIVTISEVRASSKLLSILNPLLIVRVTLDTSPTAILSSLLAVTDVNVASE